jgi:hypothetical protein
MKNSMGIIKQFWRGRVVVETDPLQDHLNPGHVVSFNIDADCNVTIRVEFANGDRYNCHPDELLAL